jgi:hypothetical protein
MWKKRCGEIESGMARLAMVEKDRQAIEDRLNNQIKNEE